MGIQIRPFLAAKFLEFAASQVRHSLSCTEPGLSRRAVPVWAIVTLAILAARVVYNWRRSGRTFASFVGLGIIRLYARLWHGCTFPRSKGSEWGADLPTAGP